jgi:hypothetical protein
LAASQVFTRVPKSVSVVSALFENMAGPQELSVTHAVQLAPLESTNVSKAVPQLHTFKDQSGVPASMRIG